MVLPVDQEADLRLDMLLVPLLHLHLQWTIGPGRRLHRQRWAADLVLVCLNRRRLVQALSQDQEDE